MEKLLDQTWVKLFGKVGFVTHLVNKIVHSSSDKVQTYGHKKSKKKWKEKKNALSLNNSYLFKV